MMLQESSDIITVDEFCVITKTILKFSILFRISN